MKITREDVLAVLGKITEPELKKDLLSANLVEQLEIEDNKVVLTVAISNPALHARKRMQEAIEFNLRREFGAELIVNCTINGKVKELRASNRSVLPQVKKIIAIASGKGGVGKSIMAVNLACSIEQILSRESSAPIKIGLMDCDVYGPSIPLLIGASGQPQALGDNLIAPIESYGIKVMSMGLLVDEETPVVWRGPMVMKTIQQFAANVDWGELDLLLIDLPHLS